jgi:hypothetical protein
MLFKKQQAIYNVELGNKMYKQYIKNKTGFISKPVCKNKLLK